MDFFAPLRRALARFTRDERGVITTEMIIVTPLLVWLFLHWRWVCRLAGQAATTARQQAKSWTTRSRRQSRLQKMPRWKQIAPLKQRVKKLTTP